MPGIYSWQLAKTGPDGNTSSDVFPLSVAPGGRFLQTAKGVPFLINGDIPWMMVAQCTNAEIDRYLNDRAARKFNTILVESPGACFTTQTPKYNNIDNNAPFTTTSYTAATFESLNDVYWQRVDYLVNQAKALGIVVMLSPAYLGTGGGSGNSADQGWDFQVNAATNGNLQTYGSNLATRYAQKNVIWSLGGDFNPPSPSKVWNIATGIRSVNANAMLTFNASRGTSAFTEVNGLTPAFNLNNVYSGNNAQGWPLYSLSATEYGRAGPLPFFRIDGTYENEAELTTAQIIRQPYECVLSGGCGHLFGNGELWGFGGYGAATTATQAMDNQLASTGAQAMTLFWNLMAAYPWQLLVPKTDTSLVTTSLGSGDSRICAARASDGSFAMISTPSSNFTVDMTNITHGSVRGRWFNPADGTYAAAAGSPYANTGTQAFTAPGDRVLVLD